MMRTSAAVFLAVFSMTALMATPAVTEQKVPENVTIERAQSKKSPVTFAHAKHSEEINCLKCHHDAKSSADAQSCFVCHGSDPDIPDPSVSGAKENPFHIRCRGCHQEQGKGPTKCKDCHKG